MSRRLVLIAVLSLVPLLVLHRPPPSSAGGGGEAPALLSAPLFASPDETVGIETVVSDSPRRVVLVLTDEERGTELGRTPMTPQASGSWHATFRPGLARHIRYAVEAVYASGERRSSDPAMLTVLERLVAPPIPVSRVGGRRLAVLHLGGPSGLGVGGGEQAARLLPPAFLVDEERGELDVLDAPTASIAVYDLEGRLRRTVPLVTGSTTASDLVKTADGVRYVADPVRDELVRWGTKGQDVVAGAGLGSAGANSRLATDGTDLYLREPTQGRHVLLGSVSSPRTRRARTYAGAHPESTSAVAAGGVNVEVAGGSVVAGDLCHWRYRGRNASPHSSCQPSDTAGLRLVFPHPVLDVLGAEMDGRGVVWMLVDTDDGAGGVAGYLASVDFRSGTEVHATPVDLSVSGDVTRRLQALAGGGAVVMSATPTELVFTRFTSL